MLVLKSFISRALLNVYRQGYSQTWGRSMCVLSKNIVAPKITQNLQNTNPLSRKHLLMSTVTENVKVKLHSSYEWLDHTTKV